MSTKFKLYVHKSPFKLKYNASLPELQLPYETWGQLNKERTNAIWLFSGLAIGSHAKSNEGNPEPGWWERFIGPGGILDTNKYFIICSRNLGEGSDSTGPESINPLTKQRYATSFPVLSVEDIVRANVLVLDHLGIDKVYACIGFSLGGMGCLLAGVLYPHRIGRLITIAGCLSASPSLIAWCYLMRRCITTDPNWNNGDYYDGEFPTTGKELSDVVATFCLRCFSEWEERFGREKFNKDEPPTLGPTFQIESYLMHKGELLNNTFDPNSVLYMLKAIGLFDVGDGFSSQEEALARVRCPVLILGFDTDLFFPINLQESLVKSLEHAGNENVTFIPLTSKWGHDACALDVKGVGTAVKGFMERQMEQRQPDDVKNSAS